MQFNTPQVGVAGKQIAYLPQHQAVDENSSNNVKKSDSFDLFGKDGFSFWDLVDIINPLQHIPVISTIYRSITGDEIDHGAKIAGGALFGGPLGVASSTFDVVIAHSTGKDLGEHAIALLQNNEAAPGPNSEPTKPSEPMEVAAIRQYTAPQAAQLNDNRAPLALIAQESAAVAGSAGMAAIPMAKDTFAERITAYAPKNFRSADQSPIPQPKTPLRTAPDLGLLTDINRTTTTLESQATGRPTSLIPKYTATETISNIGPVAVNKAVKPFDAEKHQARLAYKKALAISQDRNDGWEYQAMLQAMNKYGGAANIEAGKNKELPVVH